MVFHTFAFKTISLAMRQAHTMVPVLPRKKKRSFKEWEFKA
jgi:hypothetical protein